MKKTIIPDPVLMILTLVVIIGFQVYWLIDNYEREKRSMQIRTGLLFQETVRQLQASKLKFPRTVLDKGGLPQKTRLYIDEDTRHFGFEDQKPEREEVITMVNVLQKKVAGTLKKDSNSNATIFVAVGKDTHFVSGNSRPAAFNRIIDSNTHIYNILYKMDSLQDSLRLPDIIKNYKANLIKENIPVGFIITRTMGAMQGDEENLAKVIVGFAHPISYELSLTSTTPYLIKKIFFPILFSVLLITITVLSFLLLYRNLLRQRRLGEIKNEFISNITHELKTPLATVGVAIEALKNFNAIHDEQKTKEYLDISSSELQRLNLLVDKVLKLSMFETKQIELNKEQFDLKNLINEILDTMRPQFEKQHAIVTFNTLGENFLIRADKLHITSVLYNLIDNALKYSKSEPVIDVKLSSNENIFELKVSDNGIGIADEYRGKIFDKFFRVPTGNRHQVKGYGLGLSYVAEIITRHKGTVYIESELGKGSTFTIKLPADEA